MATLLTDSQWRIIYELGPMALAVVLSAVLILFGPGFTRWCQRRQNEIEGRRHDD